MATASRDLTSASRDLARYACFVIEALEAQRDSEDEIDQRSEAYYALLFNQLCASIDTDDLLTQLCCLWAVRLLHDGEIRTKSDRFLDEVTPLLLKATSIAIEAAEKIGFGSFAKVQTAAACSTGAVRLELKKRESPRAAHRRIKRRIQCLMRETTSSNDRAVAAIS